ncbi:MAG: reprolysin-like metallopeptidase [Bacteroidota bacterium]
MRSISIFVFVSILAIPLIGQSWSVVDRSAIPLRGERNINPEQYIVAEVNDDAIRSILWSAPDELRFNPKIDQGTFLQVMNADGIMEEFRIVQYQMMEPQLAAKFPDIRTYHGLSTNSPARRIRINYTVHGFKATITDQTGQTYIDHFQRNDKNHKIIYRRNNLRAHSDWTCKFHEHGPNSKKPFKKGWTRSGDCVFRSYRLAVTATGEYSNYHGAFSEADSSLVMSAVVTTVDRVNDVYEQDITVRLILIDNTEDIFYYDPNSDPFTSSISSSLLNQNQANTDAVIGSANYDIGHIVTTGDGGIAQLGVPCTNSKARGATGLQVPEGDPFDIDYVSHELGHQFGATHTQNNSCQRTLSTAVEPGSASTIMGYAGICSPNVQNNSDAYFHAVSIEQMNDEITSKSCHGTISLTNSAPIVSPLTDKSIPHSTPFMLDAVATDSDGDVLTYNWEQIDNEVGPVMPPVGTNAQGPMFRSIFATTDSMRYFPNIATIASNGTFQWEVLPSVDRNMDFRVTVRDNTFAPGCTDEQDITLDVEGSAGPFLVTSQNTSVTWMESESRTITWDVANTDMAPVSCSTVDIYMSYDSGLTYPTKVLSSTPNDGSAEIIVPLGITSTARVMVKCSDNVFFDINDTDINIEMGAPSFLISTNPSSGEVCDDQTIDFIIESTSILGYSDPINLTVSDLPTGASAFITTNPIIPGNNTMVSLDNMDDKSGDFTIKITGTSGSITREVFYNLFLKNKASDPMLIAPANGASEVNTEPDLSWNPESDAISYEYQVSTLPSGGDIVASGSATSALVNISTELDLATTYYWRVRSINECGISSWSEEWSFETRACLLVSANDLPIEISENGTPTIVSSLTIPDKGIINDLNIINLEGTHTYISDLNFTLIAPDGTSLAFWSDPCIQQNDFDINFDDEAASPIHPCPPTDGQTYQPDFPLTAFDTKQIKGTWQLSVFDDYNADGGSLDAWSVELCVDNYCDITVDKSPFTDSNGTLKSALECAVDGDTITLQSIIAGSTINTGSISTIIDQSITILADPSDNIKILSNGGSPTFIISTGKTVSFIGFDIENLDSVDGVIENNGTLTLQNIKITSGNSHPSIVNENGGNLIVEGNCVLEEN